MSTKSPITNPSLRYQRKITDFFSPSQLLPFKEGIDRLISNHKVERISWRAQAFLEERAKRAACRLAYNSFRRAFDADCLTVRILKPVSCYIQQLAEILPSSLLNLY